MISVFPKGFMEPAQLCNVVNNEIGLFHHRSGHPDVDRYETAGANSTREVEKLGPFDRPISDLETLIKTRYDHGYNR